MRRSFLTLASIGVLSACQLMCGCFTDPDDPSTWLKQINESSFKRRETLINLYRIYETGRALSEKKGDTGQLYKKKLVAFRKKVNPALRVAFDKKIRGKLDAAQEILEHLIMFEAKEAGPLFLRILKEYVAAETDKYGDEDAQEGVVAKALTGLGQLATRKQMPDGSLEAILGLVERICAKATSKGSSEGLDPRSFIRNAVVKAMPYIIDAYPDKRTILGKILSRILEFGFAKGQVQDPMVNIFAGRALGDVGDTSPDTVRSLVICLFRKGRGRAFHPYCTESLARLPNVGEHHPAVEPLILMMKGDPWKKVLNELKKSKRDKAAAEALEAKLKAGMDMPPCPESIPAKYRYVCDVYWTARKEKWEEKEPGVVELNSVITLREIGDLGKNGAVIRALLSLYGSESLQAKWFASIEEKKDRILPGLQMQRMAIKGYGRDMNIRLEFLYASGRTGGIKVVPELKEELKRSLRWSGDPGSMVKAAEAIARGPYDAELVQYLIEMIPKANSWMAHVFKHRMFKHASWGAVKKQCYAAETKLDELWNECMKEGDKTDEQCFDTFKKDYWLPELKKLVGFYMPNDVKDYLNPICAKGKDPRKELACKENPTKDELAKGLTHKCKEWGPCNSGNFYTCLDGDQEMRLQFTEEASKIVSQEHIDMLAKYMPEDLLRPSKPPKLPPKDTTYYDPTDHAIANNPYSIIPKLLADARRLKAIETIKRRMCYIKRRLEVVKECKTEVRCYIETLKGNKSWTIRDCRDPQEPVITSQKICWRHQEKAAYMLAQLAVGNDDAIRALCEAYKDAPVPVREAILLALDRTADSRHAKRADMGQLIFNVVDDETTRSVKGVWQINRDARSMLGRMARRKPQK